MTKVIQIAVESAPDPEFSSTLYILTADGGIAFVRDPDGGTTPDQWDWIALPDGVTRSTAPVPARPPAQDRSILDR